jgi:release factor glutamine methyltransferase
MDGARRLEMHRVSNPRLSAEVLLAHCLSVDRTFLYTHDERLLTEAETRSFEEAIYDRISGVPVQYIVGRQEFYGRYFSVNPAVLIPRPETEAIVEAVLKLRNSPAPAILDVGTGSGCIGVTLAIELPSAHVTITDVSCDALLVAKANAVRLGARVDIACMDLLDAIGTNSSAFDFIVSNLPYVSPADLSNLQPEVREHEPHVALFASDNGLALIQRFIPAAERLLKPGGYLILEIGIGMAPRVMNLLGSRWEAAEARPDLQGIPRTIVARRRQSEEFTTLNA